MEQNKKSIKQEAKDILLHRMPVVLFEGIVIGGFLTQLIMGYVIPYFFSPHSNIEILYGSSAVTIENLGNAPASWLVLNVTVKDDNSTIMRHNFTGNLNLAGREPAIACKYFTVTATDILPASWGVIQIEIDGNQGLDVAFASSCKNEPGAVVSASQTQINGEWGRASSLQEWIKSKGGL